MPSDTAAPSDKASATTHTATGGVSEAAPGICVDMALHCVPKRAILGHATTPSRPQQAVLAGSCPANRTPAVHRATPPFCGLVRTGPAAFSVWRAPALDARLAHPKHLVCGACTRR